MHEAEKRLASAQEQQRKADKQLHAVREQLETPPVTQDVVGRAKLNKQLGKVEAEVEKSSRKVAREQAKVDEATNRAKELNDNNLSAR